MNVTYQSDFESESIGSIAAGWTGVSGSWQVQNTVGLPISGAKFFAPTVNTDDFRTVYTGTAAVDNLAIQYTTRFFFTSTLRCNMDIGGATTSTNTAGYLVVISANSGAIDTATFFKRTSSSYSQKSNPTPTPISITSGDAYTVRLEISGSGSSRTLSVYVWVAGTAKPGTPFASWTDSTTPYTSLLGLLRVGKATGAPGTAIADDVKIGTYDNTSLGATIALTSASSAQKEITATATGGTLPYTYQWHRASNYDFSPDGDTAIAGATDSVLIDGSVPSGISFYKVVVTDADGTTFTSSQYAGGPWGDPIVAVCIGESTTQYRSDGTNAQTDGSLTAAGSAIALPEALALRLRSWSESRTVTAYNLGHAGYSTTYWISGSTFMNAAVTLIEDNPGCIVSIMLGANDCNPGYAVPAETFKSNLESTIGAALDAGASRIYIHYPPFIPAGSVPFNNNSTSWSDADLQLMNSYLQKIEELANGTTVRVGDRSAYPYFAEHADSETIDGIHPNARGVNTLGTFQAKAIYLSETGKAEADVAKVMQSAGGSLDPGDVANPGPNGTGAAAGGTLDVAEDNAMPGNGSISIGM